MYMQISFREATELHYRAEFRTFQFIFHCFVHCIRLKGYDRQNPPSRTHAIDICLTFFRVCIIRYRDFPYKRLMIPMTNSRLSQESGYAIYNIYNNYVTREISSKSWIDGIACRGRKCSPRRRKCRPSGESRGEHFFAPRAVEKRRKRQWREDMRSCTLRSSAVATSKRRRRPRAKTLALPPSGTDGFMSPA